MGVLVEKCGTYCGHDYIVKFLDGGWRCGYVRLSSPGELEHPDYMLNQDDLDVHGGITFDKTFEDNVNFPDGRWIGFDCHHIGDKVSVEDAEKAFFIPHEEGLHLLPDTGHYWTLEEVEAECKYLCQQLAERKEN